MFAVRWLASAGLLMVAGGCFRPVLPRLHLEQPSPPVPSLDLRAYLQAARYGEWIYDRVELFPDGETGESRRYVRRVTADRWSEGVLSRRELPSLDRYLRGDHHHHHEAATQPAAPLPVPPLPASEAPQLFELDDPIAPIPLELAKLGQVSTTTALRYRDDRRRMETTGTLTRNVRLEGTQNIDTPAGRFADCLRLRIELKIDLAHGPTIEFASYLWLSRDAGEVRRIEEFSGSLWIFRFGSAHEYRLTSYSRDSLPPKPASSAPRWKRGLITLDRGIPRPRVSGMRIDFAAGSLHE